MNRGWMDGTHGWMGGGMWLWTVKGTGNTIAARALSGTGHPLAPEIWKVPVPSPRTGQPLAITNEGER